MAAPTLQAEGTLNVVTTGDNTPTIPTHQADDILVLAVGIWGPNSTADIGVIGTPSSWTSLSGTYTSDEGFPPKIIGRIAYFWKRATGAGTTVTVARPANADVGNDTAFGARAYVIRGCATSGNPWDDVQLAGPYLIANEYTAALAVSGNERMAVHFLVKMDDYVTAPTVTGWTAGTQLESASGTDHSQGSFRKDNINANESAAASTVEAPAATYAIYAFLGVVFKSTAGPQTVTATLLGQALGAPAPQANQQVVGELVGSALGLVAPTILQSIAPATLGQATDAPAPVVIGVQVVTPDPLAVSATAVAPTQLSLRVQGTPTGITLDAPAPAATQSVAPAALGQAADAPAPVVIGAQVVNPALLGQALATLDPALAQQVVVALLGQALDAPAPQVAIAQQVVATLLGQTLDTPAPIVSQASGPQTVQPDLLGQVLAAPDPAVAQSVAVALQAITLATPAPTTLLSVAPTLLGQALTGPAPTLNQSVVVALLGQALAAPTPLVNMLVLPGLLGQALSPVAPQIASMQFVLPDQLGQALVVVAPTITVGLLPVQYRIGRRLVQMHALVFSQNASGGPDKVKLDLTPEILNVVWQRSQNLSGQAAFVLPRSSSKIASILPQQDHLMLWRETASGGARLVFQGKIATLMPGPGDVIFRAIDYLGYLQRSRTGYRTLYPSKKIGTEIVAPEWAAARTVDRGPLNFVTTGTIQDPLGLDGVTLITTNSKFGVVDFDRLFLFYALAEMSMVNTDNNVLFEITLSETAPTFNFWKNRSTARTSPVLHWPGNLASFNYAPGYDEIVTDIASIINNTTGGQEEYQVSAATGLIDTYRRLQSAVTIETLMGLSSGATETDQMKAAVNRLLYKATKLPRLFVAVPRFNEIDPFNGWDLGDTFPTFVQAEGVQPDTDRVNAALRLLSVAGSWHPDTGEQLQLYLQGK